MVDSKLIETFLVVADEKNITKAAERLYISQSTVSYRLNTLEREVGTALLSRKKGGKSVSLTTAGGEFFEIASNWVKINNQIENFANSYGAVDELSVVATESLNWLLLPVYEKLQKTKKHILIIKTAHSSQINKMILYGEAVIGFSYQPATTKEERIKCELIGTVPLVVVIKRKKDGVQEIAQSELDCSREILVDGITYGNTSIQNMKLDRKRENHLVVDGATILEGVMKDGDWCFFPKPFAQQFSNKEDMHVVPFVEQDVPLLNCYMLYRGDSYKKIETILNQVKKIVGSGLLTG